MIRTGGFGGGGGWGGVLTWVVVQGWDFWVEKQNSFVLKFRYTRLMYYIRQTRVSSIPNAA